MELPAILRGLLAGFSGLILIVNGFIGTRGAGSETSVYAINGADPPMQTISGFEVTVLGFSPAALSGNATANKLYGMDMSALGAVLVNEFGFSYIKFRFDLRDFEPSNDDSNALAFNSAYYKQRFSQPGFIKWFDGIRAAYDTNKGNADATRPKLHFSSFCAPSWLLNNSATCRGALISNFRRPQVFQEIAELWAALLVALRDNYGVDVESTVVWNEPAYRQPLHMTLAEEVETAKAMSQRFIAEGLNTKVLAGDNGVEEMKWMMENGYLSDPYFSGNKSALAGISYHTYEGGNRTEPDRFVASLSNLAGSSMIRSSGLELRMTEWSPLGSNELRNHALVWAKHIYNCHVFGRASLVDLWYVGPWQDSALNSNRTFKKQTYAFKQYAKFIQPGSRLIYPSLDKGVQDNSRPAVSAYLHSASRRLTIVIINRATSARAVHMILQNLAGYSAFEVYETSSRNNCARVGTASISNGSIEYTCPAESITTLTGIGVNPPAPPKNYQSVH